MNSQLPFPGVYSLKDRVFQGTGDLVPCADGGGCRSRVWRDMPQVKEAVLTLELNFTEMCELKRKGKKKKQRQLKKTDRRGWRKGEKDPRAFEVLPILAHLSLA